MNRSDLPVYLLAIALGISAGILDLGIGDLLLTALFVLCSTMLLGVLRPQSPWRWTLIVGVFVPLIQLLAFLVRTQRPERAQIAESCLGFVTGIAGAYGGAVLRRVAGELFGK